MYNEEWELLTEPQLLETAPLLNLSGMATQGDSYIEKRAALNKRFAEELAAQEMAAAEEVEAPEAKTPSQAEQSAADLASTNFEQVNEHLGLKYTRSNFENFRMLYQLTANRLQRQGSTEPIEAFTGEVEYIEDLITRIQNPYTQQSLQKRYIELFYEAKKLPVDRAQSFDIFRAMILTSVVDVVDHDEKARQEIGMVENFGFEPVPEDQTEEQAAEALEELKLKKAEALKRSKQKPKTEEEEAAEMDMLVKKTSETLGNSLCLDEEKIRAAEKELDLIKTRWLMDNHLKMDADMYDRINRKLSIYDIELGARDLIMRLDLDIPLSKFVEPPKIVDVVSQGKSLAEASVGKVSKAEVKKSENES
jgi:hypothetical protein